MNKKKLKFRKVSIAKISHASKIIGGTGTTIITYNPDSGCTSDTNDTTNTNNGVPSFMTFCIICSYGC